MQENKISLVSAIFMNINIMIGAGIFVIPSIMAQKAYNLSFLGWPLIGIIFTPVVLSMAKITEYFPGGGSFYTYGKDGINKSVGFLSGWLYFLGYASISALQITGLRELLSLQLNFTIIHEQKFLFNLIFVVLFCLINFLSLKLISKIQNAATIIKLIPIAFVMLLLFFYWNPNLRFNLANIANLKYTIPLTLFGFWGFEASCNISHLIKGSKKNAARAVLISFFVVVFAYTIFNLSLLHIMNAQNLINYQAPAFVDFLNIKFMPLFNALNIIVSSTILISFIGSILGMFLSNSFNLQSLVKNNLLPFSNQIKKTSKKDSPIFCILAMGTTSFIFLSLINSKEVLNSMGNFGILSCFIITFLALFLIQLKRKEYLKMIMPCLAFVSCYIVLTYSWIIIGQNNMARLIASIPLLILTILGIVLFKIKEKANGKK